MEPLGCANQPCFFQPSSALATYAGASLVLGDALEGGGNTVGKMPSLGRGVDESSAWPGKRLTMGSLVWSVCPSKTNLRPNTYFGRGRETEQSSCPPPFNNLPPPTEVDPGIHSLSCLFPFQTNRLAFKIFKTPLKAFYPLIYWRRLMKRGGGCVWRKIMGPPGTESRGLNFACLPWPKWCWM